MLYKAKVAVCSDIRTKHSTQSERHVEFLNVKPWWYGKKPLGVKRLSLGKDTSLRQTGIHANKLCAVQNIRTDYKIINTYILSRVASVN